MPGRRRFFALGGDWRWTSPEDLGTRSVRTKTPPLFDGGGYIREGSRCPASQAPGRCSNRRTSGQPASLAGQKQGGGLGLTSATGLVIGSIIGTGVFTMPAVLAAAGTSSLIVLAVVAVGAMLLAVLFGQLTKRVPKADGGLYAYARHEFGDFAGYLTAWSYWISSWAGNAAIVASWVFYVDALFGISHPSGMANWGIALVGLWVPAAVNLAGVRQMAWFQNVTVVLKFLPLLFVGVVGWFFVRSANFGPFNASGGSLYSCIGIAAGVALFSFIGVEVAAITAKRVKNPRKNVGRASVLGTGVSAILYLLVAAAVMGLVPHHALVGNGAPFVDAFQTIFPHGTWAGKLIAAVAVVSGIGALNGWTLVITECSRAPADDGLFPAALRLDRPQRHRLVRHRDRRRAALAAHAVAVHHRAPGSRSSPTWSTSPWSPWPSRTSSRPRPAHLPGVAAPPGAGLAAGPGPADRRGQRAVLAVGHLRLRLPGRLPGPGRHPGRPHPLRVPERPPARTRPGRRSRWTSRQRSTDQPDRKEDTSHDDCSVRSEVGQLRQVIVHRPGLELARLTP